MAAPRKRKADEKSDGALKKAKRQEVALDAARTAVLTTTELLEAILVCLPPNDLFVLQRVCQKFRNVIAASVHIQQKLFLCLSVPRVKHGCSSAAIALTTSFIWTNPAAYLAGRLGPYTPPTLCPYAFPGVSRGAFECELSNTQTCGGSWRDIFLTDSPVEEFRVQEADVAFEALQPGRAALIRAFDVKDEEGITLGSLFDAICMVEALHHVGSAHAEYLSVNDYLGSLQARKEGASGVLQFRARMETLGDTVRALGSGQADERCEMRAEVMPTPGRRERLD